MIKEMWNDGFYGRCCLGMIVTGCAGLLMVLFMVVGFPTGINKNHGQGEIRGIITDVWTEGTFIKTHEGRIITEGGSTLSHRFSIEDEDVLKELKEAAKSGKPVILNYREYFIKPFMTKCTYIATGFEFCLDVEALKK